LERVKSDLAQAKSETAKAELECKDQENHHKGIQSRNDELHDELDKHMKAITRANELIEDLEVSETQLKEKNKEHQTKIDEMKNSKKHIEKTLKDSMTERDNLETS
jgi:chromosome segregation ATPase